MISFLSGMISVANAQPQMKVTITTDKSVYIKGDKITIFVQTKDSQGKIIKHAFVRLAFTQGSKSYAFEEIFSNDEGIAKFRAKLPRNIASGEYVIFAIVTKSGFEQGTGIGKLKIF